MEAGVVIDVDGDPLYWHTPPDRSVGHIPDSQSLWHVLWVNRGIVQGFAHSHPGSGIPGPSGTDLTTFDAVERGLGKRLTWWIVTRDRVVALRRVRRTRSDRGTWMDHLDPYNNKPLPWLKKLRELSYGGT